LAVIANRHPSARFGPVNRQPQQIGATTVLTNTIPQTLAGKVFSSQKSLNHRSKTMACRVVNLAREPPDGIMRFR